MYTNISKSLLAVASLAMMTAARTVKVAGAELHLMNETARYIEVHSFYNSNTSVGVSGGYEEIQVSNISEKVRKKESSHQQTHYSMRIAIDLKQSKLVQRSKPGP